MIAQSLYQPLYHPPSFSLEKNDDIDINELSLYLDFALDKTLTARKGPTPTFSRGTSATRVNEAGLVQYAPENLFLNNGGASRTSAEATKYSSNELDPDGGSSCLMVVETNVASQARSSLPSSFADAYTRRRVFSWWVKPSPGVTLPAYLHLVYKDNARVSFSTATWSVATQTDGATGSIVESNGWYKLIAYLPGETSSSTTHKLVFTDTDYYGGPLTAIRGLLVGSGQLSSGTFAWPHFQTLTNPYYAPRFDHDPETFACKGLLIEEQRTNLALQSEAFPLPTWTKTNVTTAPNAIASPSGTVTADTLIEDTATSFHYISQQFAKSASSSTYSYSIYYKNASGTRTVVLALTNGTSSGKAAIFTTSGTVTATNVNIGSGAGFTFVSANVESVGNDWYRASIVVTSDTSTRLDAVTYLNNSTTVINSYTGLMSSVYLWGAQVELGSFPTSYIPTTSAAAPRSADVCSITGGDFTSFYNQSEGTAVTKVTNAAGISSTTQYPFSFTASSATELLTVFRSGTAGITPRSCRFASIVASTDTLVDTPDAGVFADNATSLAGFAIKLNDFAGSLNGNLITDTTASLPTVDRMFIGNRVDGARPWNGHIARIQYFRKRLPNAKLQSLTTP